MGSSPRMRGTQRQSFCCDLRIGIIPAYAGNTMAVMFSSMEVRDHPRVCGEHWFRPAGDCTIQGSSPRMRGTPRYKALGNSMAGIIPAYAGNTWLRSIKTCRARDHPRVCGEHLIDSSLLAACFGSSPRMRGTPACCRMRVTRSWIIPAYAGNTHDNTAGTAFLGDHPRVCGEHTKRLA